MTRTTLRSTPALLAVGLALTLAPMAAAAQEPTTTPPVAAVETDPSIDVTHHGSLELMAIANDEAKRVAVPGVTFDLAAVAGVDLSTTDGLARAREIIDDPDLLDEHETATVRTLGPTDENGRAWAEDVPVGLYVLTQDGEDDEHSYRPMIFTLPSTDPVTGEWVHDLRIYPKPVPEDCDCTDDPDPTEVPTPQPTPPPTAAPTQPAPSPQPTIPTGELSPEAQNWFLIGAGGALIAGAGYLATRRGGEKGQHSASGD